MSELLDLLDVILDIGTVYRRYGLKGCVLIILAIVALLAIIIALAYWLGE